MKITSKGQVTIPDALRRQHGFLPDTEVFFESRQDGIFLKKGTPSGSGRTRGEMMVEHLRGSGTSKYSKWTTEKLMKLLRG
jgi:bifunctional DNA-binding transcriptional regulator/antitoxin component of YhaV-PrlF toxin-antitoxin module